MLDAIIIGAGWSGAVAARDLSAKGHSVLVLEARDRIGGRAKTWTDKGGKGIKVDVGCSWIHGYKEGNPARKIAESLGVSSSLPKPADSVIYGPDGPLDAKTSDSLRSSLSAAQAAFKLPHPAPPPSKSLASALFAPDSPLFSASASPNPSSDVNQTSPADPRSVPTKSVSANVHKDLAMSLARSLEVPLGLRLEQASLKWSGWETTTSFAGSDAAPDGGYESLVGKVIDEAKKAGVKVKLSCSVKSVKQEGDSVIVVDQNGEKYTAKTVICTIPLGVLKRMSPDAFSPALPDRMQEAIKGTHVGVLEKLILAYSEAWWPDAQTVGSYTFLPTSTEPLTEASTPRQVLDGSTLACASFACPTLPNPTPTLLTYLSETPATHLLKFPVEEVVAAYHQFLIDRLKPQTKPSDPTEGGMTNWLTDPLAYGATTTPSIISENGERSPMDFKELSRPVWDGKLGFAGEHTEMEHRGSVAGAVVSGMREAERVDRRLKRLQQ